MKRLPETQVLQNTFCGRCVGPIVNTWTSDGGTWLRDAECCSMFTSTFAVFACSCSSSSLLWSSGLFRKTKIQSQWYNLTVIKKKNETDDSPTGKLILDFMISLLEHIHTSQFCTFYLHLKMTVKKPKHCNFLSLIWVTKSKLL